MLTRTDESSCDSGREERQLCASHTLGPVPSFQLCFSETSRGALAQCSEGHPGAADSPVGRDPRPREPPPAPGPKPSVFIRSAALSVGDELGVRPLWRGQGSQKSLQSRHLDTWPQERQEPTRKKTCSSYRRIPAPLRLDTSLLGPRGHRRAQVIPPRPLPATAQRRGVAAKVPCEAAAGRLEVLASSSAARQCLTHDQ